MRTPSKLVFAIILAAILFMIAIPVTICIVLYTTFSGLSDAEYYEMGNDRIVSVRAVLGERDVKGISMSDENGTKTVIYRFQSETSTEDVSAYAAYLVKNEGFLSVQLNPGDAPVYIKKSVEEGKMLMISLANTGFGFALKMQKGLGSVPLLNAL